MSYEEGDREYVDGWVSAPPAGEFTHGLTVAAVGAFLWDSRKRSGMKVVTRCRMRVSTTRVRLPDVAVVPGARPKSRIIDTPPFLVVEILSPEDRASRMEERIDDYLRFGVAWIWVLDPLTGRGHIYHKGSRIPVSEGIYRTENPAIEMNFFELLD